MLYAEYKNKMTELEKQSNEVFKKIKDSSIPSLEDSDWYIGQCSELNEYLTKLYEIYHEFRQLQANQYSLLVPEDEAESVQVQETQEENDDVAVAAAGVAAIINLFRKARA